MNIEFSNISLLIPGKSDTERDMVAAAWTEAGGNTIRLEKFWKPPAIDTGLVKIYGDWVFCLALQSKLDIKLVSPDDYLLLTLDQKWLKREITLSVKADIDKLQYPLFVKPLLPKDFRSGIYNNAGELEQELFDQWKYTKMLSSEITHFESEVRCFILNNNIETMSVYEGKADPDYAREFVESFLACEQNRRLLVNTYVLDVGYIKDKGWAIIEANPVWGAGLNGCNPSKAINCIFHGTKAKRLCGYELKMDIDVVQDVLYNGSLDEMRKLKGLDITYDFNLFSSNLGSSTNLRVGHYLMHADGYSDGVPNCVKHFGFKHDFMDDYT